MIACPRCGWFADVPRDRENAVWAEHQRDPFCAGVEPVHAPRASPYRAACASRAIDETPSVSAGNAYRPRQRCRCVPALVTAIERDADE
jgi:hypothetical protein